MSSVTYEKELVGLLVVDPYNDFISEGGKVWGRVKEVAEAVNCVPNMRRILQTSRALGLRIFFAPHRRWRDGDYATWKYLAPIQERANHRKTFQYGTWGGEFHPDFRPLPNEIVAQEHWCSSGFANTDLDLLLKRHGIQQLIIIGLLAFATGLTLLSAASYGETPILSLPYTISVDGTYIIDHDLTYSGTLGNAITVNASNVTVNLNGYHCLHSFR